MKQTGPQDFDYQDLKDRQLPRLQELVQRLHKNSPFYRRLFAEIGLTPEDIKSVRDLEHLPLTDKADLRNGDSFHLMAVPEEEVVRIHSSSGTTGKPIIIPYTKQDVYDWAVMMARCMTMAGVTSRDRVQVTPGYGLWTAGIGFQAGVEHLGAMAIPTGPGNTEKQIEMMLDLHTTVLTATASYALLLGEEVQRRGIQDRLCLKKGILGSERWGQKMRQRIEELLGIETFDIYGLTEIYGPGIGLDCPAHEGIHIWTDYLLLEIIDPVTGAQLPPGELGELVITTLTKEGMPLLRYRTHDLTCLKVSRCSCGSAYPMIERILGRTDDMVKIKGVNIYPGQLDHIFRLARGAGSEYQLILTREQGKDRLLVKIEYFPGYDAETVALECRRLIKSHIGLTVDVEGVPLGELPRSEKKTRRVFDYRDK